MGIFDKAKDMLKGNEQHADGAVDRAGDMLDERTGGRYAEHVDRGQDFLKQQYGGGQAADPVEPAPGENPDVHGGQPGEPAAGQPMPGDQVPGDQPLQADQPMGAGVDGAPGEDGLRDGLGQELGGQEQDATGGVDAGPGSFDNPDAPLDQRDGDITPGQEGMGLGSPDMGAPGEPR